MSVFSSCSLLNLEIIAWAIPIAIKAAIVEDPPDDTNNNGTPVIGINPETPPKLTNKCNSYQNNS